MHCGGGQANDPEYVYKLWLAHGVTTVRGVPCGGMDWTLQQRELSAKNQIVAPRIFAYHRPFSGEGWDRSKPRNAETAREWVRFAAKKGVDGLKLGADDPEIMAALLDEAKKMGLGSTAHLDQMGVVRMNAREASRLGLGALTHYYGLFESLLKDYSIQPYPVTQNYNDEQHRFGQVARLWDKIHPRGSEPWNALIKEWVDRRFVIDPTMTIYSAGRDVMRMRNADWHDKYTLPSLWDFYSPTVGARLLLVRLDHRRRDRVEELLSRVDVVPERLQERRRPRHHGIRLRVHLSDLRLRLHPRARDAAGSRLPSARSHSLGDALRRRDAARAEGQADRVRHPARRAQGRPGDHQRKPAAEFQDALRHGRVPVNDAINKPERVGGIDFVVKDGIVYDAKKLLADVAAKVEKAKAARRTTTSQR